MLQKSASYKTARIHKRLIEIGVATRKLRRTMVIEVGKFDEVAEKQCGVLDQIETLVEEAEELGQEVLQQLGAPSFERVVQKQPLSEMDRFFFNLAIGAAHVD